MNVLFAKFDVYTSEDKPRKIGLACGRAGASGDGTERETAYSGDDGVSEERLGERAARGRGADHLGVGVERGATRRRLSLNDKA